MRDIPVRYSSGEFEEPQEEVLHLCIGCSVPGIRDVLDVYDYFLATEPGGKVVGMMKEDGTTVTRDELNIDDHGNVAIIENALGHMSEVV